MDFLENNDIKIVNTPFITSTLSIPIKEHFILYFLRIKSIKSKNTARNYGIDILQFFNALDNKVHNIEDVTVNHIRIVNIVHAQNWILYLTKKGFSSATINRKHRSLSSLYKWLQKFNIVERNPFFIMSDELPRINNKETECLNYFEVKRLLASLTNNNIKDIRDKAIISLILTTALRKTELLNIKIKDIVSIGSFILIKIYGKGNKEDFVKLRLDVKKHIDKYLYLTGRNYKDKELYLFGNIQKTDYSQPLSKKALNKMIKKRCENVNIKKNITVHALRHTAITLVVQSNKFSIEQVRDFARHNSIVTTNKYIHNKNKFENYCGDIIVLT